MSLEAEARAEAEEQFPLGGDSVVQHCGRNGFKQGALWAISRITPEQVVSVLRKHQLDEPSGGTASLAWCNCSCGYQARIREGTRDYAKSLAIAHQALMILSLYRGENGDDDA